MGVVKKYTGLDTDTDLGSSDDVISSQRAIKFYVDNNVSGKQDTSNLVTSLSNSSTDSQYPSAKCVYDLIGDVESLINAL